MRRWNHCYSIFSSVYLLGSSLAGLLDVRREDAICRLNDLLSILNIPEEQAQPIRLYHPSFREFVLNHKRCRDLNFLEDEKQARQSFTDSCIQLMSAALTQHICGLDTPDVLVAELERSQVEQYLLPEV